jgi:hypothetical protein
LKSEKTLKVERWSGEREKEKVGREKWKRIEFPRFQSTFDIIRAAEQGLLPKQIMLTLHPQRWHDKWGPWMKELVWQNVKNVVKWGINKGNNQRQKR